MAENLSTIIGKDSAFTGEMEVKGTLRIDGRIKGRIICDETVSIGATGEVEAEIDAKMVIVAGTVVGNIRTSEKIEMQAKAKVLGDVSTKNIVIEQGAIFHGSCQMKGVKEGEIKADKMMEKKPTG
ncbi:MAG: polymer-forming cytoskeletal protein [candidate division Zixibacteria bacterium]|jgi:cytoskeletal protein CcmA (bactofilin family)|nr:polymer-forming cytoskeletal protein [candidate division Zixibacteria bacterium]